MPTQDLQAEEYVVMCLDAQKLKDLAELYPATADSLKYCGLEKRHFFHTEMERQERYYKKTHTKGQFKDRKITETSVKTETSFSQNSNILPDYSSVKLHPDEVDLEEFDGDKKQRQMFEDTSRAVKEMVQV